MYCCNYWIYDYINNHKKEICKHILSFLKSIRSSVKKYFIVAYPNGKPYYEKKKFISLCSNDKKAVELIHTFYSKYPEFDKFMLANIFKEIGLIKESEKY